ncbi:MAG: MotA/TolQ/ExbB proton channel family protein [Myxococcota bacterium]
MDRLVPIGLFLGLGALFDTQLLEGGPPAALAQGPAAVIVGLGTLGATLLSSTREALDAARVELRAFLARPEDRRGALPGRFRDLAFAARKEGLVALDRHMASIPSPFMRRALRHVIDGCDEQQLRALLEADIETRMRARLTGASVFDAAGGYAPTMGILGAVLGLVRAMEALADPDAHGQGIAVAFIATIYGVGLANLALIPLATRIRRQVEAATAEDEIVMEGALALQAGVAPRTIERLLRAHLPQESPT